MKNVAETVNYVRFGTFSLQEQYSYRSEISVGFSAIETILNENKSITELQTLEGIRSWYLEKQ